MDRRRYDRAVTAPEVSRVAEPSYLARDAQGLGGRPVRIVYSRDRPPSPSTEIADGLVIVLMAIVSLLAAAVLVLAWIGGADMPFWLRIVTFVVAAFSVWSWIGVARVLGPGLRNLGNKHVMHGYVIDWRAVLFDLGPPSGDPGDSIYVAVDDGTRDEIFAWRVGDQGLPVGTAVSARVTGDRRYLYRLWPASDT